MSQDEPSVKVHFTERTILPTSGSVLDLRSALRYIPYLPILSLQDVFPLFCQDVVETSGATRVPRHRFTHISPAFYPSPTPKMASNATRVLSESGISRA